MSRFVGAIIDIKGTKTSCIQEKAPAPKHPLGHPRVETSLDGDIQISSRHFNSKLTNDWV